MIGIYLRPDRTQIVKARIRNQKNIKRIEVLHTEILPSYLQHLEDGNVHYLVEMFEEIKTSISTFSEEVYVVFPDAIFDLIDCKNHGEQSEIIKNRLNLTPEEVYTVCPIELKMNEIWKVTTVIIQRTVIDALAQAAKEADISLVSVEPAGFAFLRALEDWEKEHFLVETVFDNRIIFTSYSPIAGVYSFGISENVDNDEKARDVLTQNNILAKKTFNMVNIDVPIFFLSQTSLMEFPSFKQRLAEQRGFTDRIIPSGINPEDWAIPVGTLLQCFEGKGSDLYNLGKLHWLTIRSANILPDSIKRQSNFSRFQKVARKYSKILIAALSVIVAVQMIGILYFSSEQIPEALQNDFNKANKEMDLISKELDLIQQAKKEEQHPTKALETLLPNKPKELGFSMIEIGEKNRSSSENSKEKIPWIQFTVKSADPMAIRDYTTILSEAPIFTGITIEQISASSGLKTANVRIYKGKVE